MSNWENSHFYDTFNEAFGICSHNNCTAVYCPCQTFDPDCDKRGGGSSTVADHLDLRPGMYVSNLYL